MNCFSAFAESALPRALLPVVLALLGAVACGISESESAGNGDSREYNIRYRVQPDPANSAVHVEMRLRQPSGELRELSFTIPPDMQGFAGDGNLAVDGRRARWTPPKNGGTLTWVATIHNERGDGSFDALLNPNWGIFRLEDVIPRARTRTLKGAVSRTTLDFDLPPGWSVITEYSAIKHPIVVDRPQRRFDQPAGWLAMGQLGVRRDTIAGTRVAIAGPEGHAVRRLDMLALLNWTLPELTAILPGALPRLTVISAGEPMWRGGLSGPASLFIHADRPLISENATSPLLHEVMHVALGVRGRQGHDWIAEGLAEFYGIELLRRGKAISASRAKAALEWQADWGKRADALCGSTSTAATTALAVTVLADLHRELKKATPDSTGLDALLPALVDQEVDLNLLLRLSEDLSGSTPDALHIDKLPGCRRIQ